MPVNSSLSAKLGLDRIHGATTAYVCATRLATRYPQSAAGDKLVSWCQGWTFNDKLCVHRGTGRNHL